MELPSPACLGAIAADLGPAPAPTSTRPLVGPLHRRDLAEVAGLFQHHTGRPADLETMGRWLDTWPSAGARCGDQLVGYLLCCSFAPDIAEIASFLVAPDARGSGIGEALIRQVELDATARGLGGLIGVTSLGYEVAGEKRLSSPLFVRLGYRIVLETAGSHVYARTLPVEPT